MAKRKSKQKTKRVCLRCDREFMSDGIYNRICPNCQNANSNFGIVQKDSSSSRFGNGSTRRGLSDET
jgi:hypothetical protein